MLNDLKLVAVSIGRPFETVYQFVRAPQNLPKWAAGLAAGIWQEGSQWVADSPMGRVLVHMVEDNAFGVLDHDVHLPDGTIVHNVFRASPNGDGCDLVFMVHRAQGMDAAAFERDVAQVDADLEALKRLLESQLSG